MSAWPCCAASASARWRSSRLAVVEHHARVRHSAQPRGGGERVDAGTAPDECLSGHHEPEGQCRHQRRRPVARPGGLDGRAEVDQRVDERHLQSRPSRVVARDQHAHRRMLTAVHVRERVRIRSCFEQHRRDRDRILGCPLAIPLDAVGGDVVQQRGPMHRRVEMRHARRARVHQVRMCAEQRLQRGEIAVDDGFHRRFEAPDG